MLENLLVTEQKKDERKIISQCCVCKDFVMKDGSYKPLNKEQTKKAYTNYLVSHGYCLPCFNNALIE